MAKKKDLPTLRIVRFAETDGIACMSDQLVVSDRNWNDTGLFERPVRLLGGMLAVCTGGRAQMTINLESYEVRSGDLLVVFQGSIVQVPSRSEDFRLGLAVFANDFLRGVPQSVVPLYPYIFQHPVCPLPHDDAQMLLDFLSLLRAKAARRNHIYVREIALHLLLALFFEISAIYQRRHPMDDRTPNRSEEIFKKLMRLVMLHYKEQRNTGFYARELCLSPKYLSAVVKRVSDKSVVDWINETVVLEAQAQLKTTRMTVQEISDYLNFPNPSFFGRFFKKHTGMTPKAFRDAE